MNMATVFLLLSCSLMQMASASIVNLALGKPTLVSSMQSGYRASTAVDGNTVANSGDPSKIILTSTSQSSAWWRVDLQREVQDATVRIYFRTDSSIVNLALGKPTLVSSMQSGYRASTAVDGNTVANSGDPSKIILTSTSQSSAWWRVDLQREVQDATVRIYFRTDYTVRRNGVTLYTSTSPLSGPTGQWCHTVRGAANGRDINSTYSVTCPGRWRYLVLYTNTRNDGLAGAILDFGEVEVFLPPCDNGNYGTNCDKLCSDRKCKAPSASSCDRDGTCPDGCEPGWRQVDCTLECVSGFYGSGCSLSCTTRKCLDSTSDCNHVTGQCGGGCQAGYKGTDCRQECDSGLYGSACSLSCTDRKCIDSSSRCDHVTGQCECKPGYIGTDCTHKCWFAAYGPGCSSFCTDRKCLDASSPCDHVTGQCVRGCQAGYNGTDCIQACSPGVTYGVNCEKSCSSRHCMTSPSTCDPKTGQCPDGCEPGWRGIDCNSPCPWGTYGPDCTERCGKCDGVCDSVDGRCPAGCMDNYNGTKCDVALPAIQDSESTCFTAAYVVGAAVGSVLAVVLAIGGIILCLVRQGRLQWVKKLEDKKPVSHDVTQMSNIATQPSDISEHAHTSGHVYNNDYAVLDSGTKADNKHYDVIEHKHYQNV